MRNIALLLAFGIVIVSGFYFYSGKEGEDTEGVFCSMEAKICPDGSFVGRSGPKCEFATCPIVLVGTSAKLHKAILNNGVVITPLEVLSDSRCPVDVQCIQAGSITLKVRLFIGDDFTEEEIISGSYVDFVGKRITLVKVSPEAHSQRSIFPEDYIFEFKVK